MNETRDATASPSLDAELEERKNRIFCKVGRNVVNLQRLEIRLKGILSVFVDAPLSKLPKIIERRSEVLMRQTMGPLTHEIVDRLIPEPHPQGTFEHLATEFWINVSVRMEADVDLRRELKAKLKKLVDDRNELVHHMFGGFDPRSVESCAQLELRLDDQRSQISEVFNWVEELGCLVKEHAAQFAQALTARTSS